MFRKVHGDAATELLQARKGWNSGPVLRPPVFHMSTRLMVAVQLVKALFARAAGQRPRRTGISLSRT